MRKEFFIKNKKGQKICVVTYTRKGRLENKPTLIFCHGFTGFKEEFGYWQFFSILLKHDYQVVAFDMNGHGKSYGDLFKFTMTKVLDDFHTVYNYVKKYNIKRMAIAGHSLGGAACLLIANYLEIQSLVLISPVTDRFYFNRSRLPTKTERNFLKSFGFLPRISDSKGKAFLIGKDFFRDFTRHQIRKEAIQIKRPILLIHAEKDESVPLKEAKELYKTFDFEITDFKVIKGAGHIFERLPEQKQVMDLTIDWFNRYLKKKRDYVMVAFLQGKDGKILLLKRNKRVSTHPGLWNGVGGYIEKGEGVVQAAKRELKEELGVKAKDLKFLRVTSPFRLYESKYDKDWIIRWVLFKTKTEKIKPDWETETYKWIFPKEYEKYKTTPHLKVGLKRLKLI